MLLVVWFISGQFVFLSLFDLKLGELARLVVLYCQSYSKKTVRWFVAISVLYYFIVVCIYIYISLFMCR